MKTIIFCVGVAQLVVNPAGTRWVSGDTLKVRAAQTDIINPLDTGNVMIYDTAGDSVLLTIGNCNQ